MKSRNEADGYALISTMVIGAFAVMFLMALSATLLSISRAQSVEKQKALLLNALDCGLDYALQKMNTDPYAFNEEQVYFLGSEFLPGEESLSDDLKTKVQFKIKSVSDADWTKINTFSALNSSIETSPGPVLKTSIRTPFWKVLEVTAIKGVFSKSVRTVLEPHLYAAKDFDGSSSDSVVNTTKKSIFTAPVFANENIEYSGSSTTLNGSMQSNSDFKIASDEVLDLQDNSTLKGRNFSPKDSGDATITGGEVQFSGKLSGISIENAVPTSPSIENVMPSPINYSGQALPTNNSPLQGQYLYTGTDPLNMNLNVSPDSPAQIFVDSNSSVDLNSSTIKYSGTPLADSMNLQIYYSGANDVSVTLADGKPFNATIYAPNATIRLKGEGNSSTFNGALVGRKVEFDNISNINLNPDVSNVSSPAAQSSGLVYREISEGPLRGNKFFQYKPVTWQEVSTKLVP